MSRSHEARIITAAADRIFALDLSTHAGLAEAWVLLRGLTVALHAIGSPVVHEVTA